MNAYILNATNLYDSLTILETSNPATFSFEIKDNPTVFSEFQPGDVILGCFPHPSPIIKMMLTVKDVVSPSTIIVEKTLESSWGVPLPNALIENYLAGDLVEIDLSQYSELFSGIITAILDANKLNDSKMLKLKNDYIKTICEDDFVNWLASTNLQSEKQIQFHYYLKSFSSSLGVENIFSIRNVSDYERYIKEIEKNDFYKEIAPALDSLSVALELYKQYLEERTLGLYTESRLAEMLKEWYADKPVEGNLTSSLVGYGFKYGASIQKNKISSNKLLSAAGIDSTMSAYIDRGVDLYVTVRKSSVGISFADCNTLEEKKALQVQTNLPRPRSAADSNIELEWNRIIFGAPGTGKSFRLDKDKEVLVADGGEYERVTFHPDYSYAQFVGTYKPITRDNGEIEYSYVPGPFMRALVKAYRSAMSSTPNRVLLIIEEINRANMAAVFGDVFQLLDRENGISQYPIQVSEDIKKHLKSQLGVTVDSIRLPDNFYIWATMNSADQGVFPMDTAFKRRWNFTYIGIDDNDADIRGKTVVLGTSARHKVEWNKLRKAINNFLAEQKINEDKQLGPYFVSRRIVVPESGDEIDSAAFIDVFKNKVLMYLFEDAAKQKRSTLFEGCFGKSGRYSEVCHEFEDKGIGIFYREIQEKAEPEDLPGVTVKSIEDGDEQI